MKQLIIALLLSLLVTSCSENSRKFEAGNYLGVIELTPDGNLNVPFNFDINNEAGKITLTIHNADEHILVDEVELRNDTLLAKLPVFTSELLCVVKGDSLKGQYYPKGIKTGSCYNFYALRGETDRFPWFTQAPDFDVTGRWWFIENPGNADSTLMIAELKQEGSNVTGTILSTTGDYRYLAGKVAGNHFYFSKNDGAQTIIIKGEVADQNTMTNGTISGSPRWISSWRAQRDSNAQLPNAEQIVWVKKGFSSFNFAGTNLNGEIIRSTDARYKGKVLAVLAGGSWCPNCLDECRYYNTLHQKYADKGFEVVSLCFEDKTFEAARPKIERFAKNIGGNYEFLYVAPRGRAQRDSVLYPIEGQMAYPTSLILDRNGVIRRVETGFSGQGTGEHFAKFAKETEELVVELLR